MAAKNLIADIIKDHYPHINDDLAYTIADGALDVSDVDYLKFVKFVPDAVYEHSDLFDFWALIISDEKFELMKDYTCLKIDDGCLMYSEELINYVKLYERI